MHDKVITYRAVRGARTHFIAAMVPADLKYSASASIAVHQAARLNNKQPLACLSCFAAKWLHYTAVPANTCLQKNKFSYKYIFH